jgi:hypothetical protein
MPTATVRRAHPDRRPRSEPGPGAPQDRSHGWPVQGSTARRPTCGCALERPPRRDRTGPRSAWAALSTSRPTSQTWA